MLKGLNRRRGIFLPLVLVIMVLVMFSVFLLSMFGSETRNAVRNAEGSRRVSLAARSAIVEARRIIETQLRGDPAAWDPFWQGMLPPVVEPSDPTAKIDIAALVTTGAWSKMSISTVEVRCVHRKVVGSRAQGLLGFTCHCQWTGAPGVSRSTKRTEWHRFVVNRIPGVGLRVFILPGWAAARNE